MEIRVLREGYLQKQGPSGLRTWKTRYFTLTTLEVTYRKNKDNGALLSVGWSPWQKRLIVHAPAVVLGRFSLSDVKGAHLAHKKMSKRAVFEVITPERVYMLAAQSVPAAQEWIDDILANCGVVDTEEPLFGPQPGKSPRGQENLSPRGQENLIAGEEVVYYTQSNEEVLCSHHVSTTVKWLATLKMTNYRLILQRKVWT